MISRQWLGLAKTEQAEAYVEHLRAETFPALQALPGFAGASILRRDTPPGVEFLVVTQWASLEAVRAFAGADVEAAVVPRKVHDMMVAYDRTVRHYEVMP
jgi:heme-degrading monooxygenase HmoA